MFGAGFGLAESIAEPFFFKNSATQVTTVNGADYRNMVVQFFVLKLQDMNVDDMWFQKDGGTCYRTRKTIQLLYGVLIFGVL